MKALGIDVGSLTTKAVLLDGQGPLVHSIISSGEEAEASAKAAVEQLLARTGLNWGDLYIVATGSGAKALSFASQQKTITTCLARGIRNLFPTARLAIDMGAETSTVIKVNERGRLTEWAGQDKCAAGTGMFLQQMSKLMLMTLEDMSRLSFNATSRAGISNTCAVFAESEVISHVHRVPPTPKEDIIYGIFFSVVSRLMSLCKRIGIEKDVAVSGGVARNRGLVNILSTELGFEVLVPPTPQIVGALGAAVLARENLERST